MYRGKLGNWLAIRMGNDLHEMDKGTIPNQARSGARQTVVCSMDLNLFWLFTNKEHVPTVPIDTASNIEHILRLNTF